MPEPIIKTKGANVIYGLGKSNEVHALKDVSVEIYPEEYIVFFGPSGCGKSTLLYLIAGLEFATQGEVIVNGKDVKSLSTKELNAFYLSTIGIIFQSFYLISDFSAKDNILFPQIFAGAPVAERNAKAEALIQRFDLTKFIHRRPSFLSGGQQQRIAIARALVNDPSIILADEPVGNLDSKNAEAVMNLLKEFNEKDKKTVILVTHDPSYLSYADRVVYMKDGQVTKIVQNTDKKKATDVPTQQPSELERLNQLYPYATNTKLKAKLILNHLLSRYNIEEQQAIEKIIEDYLLQKINKEEMLGTLDRSLEKGGIALYSKTALNFTEKIASLAEKMEIFKEEKEEERNLDLTEERAIILRRELLDHYYGRVSLGQVKRLDEALVQRILNKIQKGELEKILDMPFNKGGVGLNKRTAKRFVEEIEIILIK